MYSPTKLQRPGLLKRYNLYSVFLRKPLAEVTTRRDCFILYADCFNLNVKQLSIQSLITCCPSSTGDGISRSLEGYPDFSPLHAFCDITCATQIRPSSTEQRQQQSCRLPSLHSPYCTPQSSAMLILSLHCKFFSCTARTEMGQQHS